jgi:hypothetical protein
VAGRALVWSDERVRQAAAGFVVATDETWRLQNGDDAECRHFQAMADQGHYGHPRAEGEPRDRGTRQGIYACAPSGVLLASINALDADAVLGTIERAQAAWAALPDEQRWLASGVELRPAHRWEWSCPDDGLVLVRTVRELPADLDPTATPLRPSNRDHAWFSAGEARLLLPEPLEPGRRTTVPPLVVRRLARFHLVDNIKGQTLPFAEPEVSADSWLASEVVSRDGDAGRAAPDRRDARGGRGPLAHGRRDLEARRRVPARRELRARGPRRLVAVARRLHLLRARGARRVLGLGLAQQPQRGRPRPDRLRVHARAAHAAGRVPPAFIDAYDAGWIVRPPAR